jgi:hypothetical protein
VVKPDTARVADIHRGPLAHGLQAFEDFYAVCSIFHPLLAKRGICPYRINPSPPKQISNYDNQTPNNFQYPKQHFSNSFVLKLLVLGIWLLFGA